MSSWRPLRPELGPSLVDARLQFHHAAQLATALGISYLPARPDDSHTNLEWVERLSALASNVAVGSEPIRLAASPKPFSLIIVAHDSAKTALSLQGRTIADAAEWVREQLSQAGFRAEKYTLSKHYTIPPHRVDNSAPFDATASEAFEQLSAWYSDAAVILGDVVVANPTASVVRCWPHHFDIATLVEVSPARDGAAAKTIGVGMEPGDVYYAEPYYYVNTYPQPRAGMKLPALDGGGHWHTHEWIGAVLPASRIGKDGQREQIAAFVASAITGARTLSAPPSS